MWLGSGALRVKVPMWMVLEHDCGHSLCVPSFLLFDCEDELVQRTWRLLYLYGRR